MRPGLVERIMPGAFDRALRDADDVRALYNHDPNMVLGRTRSGTLSLVSDQRGLRYEIALPDTQLGRDLPALLRRGDVSGSSFSFSLGDRAADQSWVKQNDGTTVREIRSAVLYDVGPVTFPAYAGTSAHTRSLDDIEREAAEATREAACTDDDRDACMVRARLVDLRLTR